MLLRLMKRVNSIERAYGSLMIPITLPVPSRAIHHHKMSKMCCLLSNLDLIDRILSSDETQIKEIKWHRLLHVCN